MLYRVESTIYEIDRYAMLGVRDKRSRYELM